MNRFYEPGRYPKMRAGRNRMLFTNDKKASTAIPTILNGIDSSQTSGHSSKAKIAKGAHSTNSSAHKIIISNIFIIDLSFRFYW